MLVLWLIIIGFILYMLELFVFSNTKSFWIGGIFPLIVTISIIGLLLTNPVGWKDVIMAIVAVAVTLAFWAEGHERYKKRVYRESHNLNTK
ncbi:hypothetical protein [Companilactobacillus mishanensis]|uniref:Uncharacterized protein n=1 Tax=Companilactobacillus mishanensis TaxID=2486008 RepID=A0A5P0ZJY0_9LACO|nr:hypothetical protein [Companilactobacillus mishanensis]MQS53400.1 hypothetical protein [Companilactobacillus mishanensis]